MKSNAPLFREAYDAICAASVPLQRVIGGTAEQIDAAQRAHKLLGQALDAIQWQFPAAREPSK